MNKLLESIKNIINRNFLKKDNLMLEKEEKTFEDELLYKYGNCAEKQKYNLKILFIADTHNCLTYDNETLNFIKNVKDYDYCILLGDHSADDLVEILKIIPKEKICGVLGNHDKPFTNGREWDAHSGMKGITEYIYKNHIPLHIHGHLHEESEEILKNGTKSICLYKAKLLEI